jgi:hypothetical protein
MFIATAASSIAASNEASTTNRTQDLSTHEIREMMSIYGVKGTVEKLYGDPDRWSDLLRQIASGKDEWLKLAVDLRAGSDAGTSAMLKYAIGEALENAPEIVLKSGVDECNLADICRGPDIDDSRYSSYEKALNAVNRRIEALGRIQNQSIDTKRNFCIQKLKESIPHLQHFFGAK